MIFCPLIDITKKVAHLVILIAHLVIRSLCGKAALAIYLQINTDLYL